MSAAQVIPHEDLENPAYLPVRPIEPSWMIMKEGEPHAKYVFAKHKDAALKLTYPDYTWTSCIPKHMSFVPCWVYSGCHGWVEVYELQK